MCRSIRPAGYPKAALSRFETKSASAGVQTISQLRPANKSVRMYLSSPGSAAVSSGSADGGPRLRCGRDEWK